MKQEKGFSLIELLIVVGIIGIISALAIPGLRKAKQAAQAASAVQSLRMITTAQHLYQRTARQYGDLPSLLGESTIDPGIAAGVRSGYSFVLVLAVGGQAYTVSATPEEAPTVSTHYFVDESGVIRYNDGAPATVASLPIPK